jgi:hypothetical protein
MPTKRTFIWPIDASGNPISKPLLVTKTPWQQVSEKAGWFVSGMLAGLGLAACAWAIFW